MMGTISDDTQVQAFRINVPQQQLDDLRARLEGTRWPDSLPDVGWSRGVPPAYLQTLAEHWRDRYDWRVHEAAINERPQSTTVIDGQTIHFQHVRSPEPQALPLLLLHGWPGAFLWFEPVIDRLTNTGGDGANPAEAYHLVVPSLPGFGFSMPLSGPGWGTERMATAMLELMTRLGYDRFGVQGSDFGSWVATAMGRQAPERVIGVHVNALVTFPIGIEGELEGLSEDDQRRYHTMERYNDGYLQIQAKSPHTLAYGLHDSPVAQLAWIVELYHRLIDKPEEVGPDEALGNDRLLTIVSLYWLTGTGGTSAQLYYEDISDSEWSHDDNSGTDDAWGGSERGEGGTEWSMSAGTVPTAVLLGTTDVTIRRFAERDHDIVRWTELDRGGHFLPLEQPSHFADDVRAFFERLR